MKQRAIALWVSSRLTQTSRYCWRTPTEITSAILKLVLWGCGH